MRIASCADAVIAGGRSKAVKKANKTLVARPAGLLPVRVSKFCFMLFPAKGDLSYCLIFETKTITERLIASVPQIMPFRVVDVKQKA